VVLAACGTAETGAENDGTTTDTAPAPASASGSDTNADPPPGGAGDYESPDLPEEFQDQSPPGRAGAEFSTNFSRATVSYGEVMSGGPPKDGIPSIDEPRFVGVEAADEWLADEESVLVVTAGKEDARETHVYPIQILMWHEIVNDRVGGRPITVTYCPLCNTGIAFDRRFDGRTLDFGTTGRLRYSNLIMYDRQTETWWQQATGKGIAGRYAGGELEILPMLMLPWSDVKAEYPDADVLSRDTGYNRSYGRNPYTGYDTASRPFLYRGPTDDQFDPMTRVLTVFHDDAAEAFPYPTLRDERVLTSTIGGDPVVVFWQPGTASPLDTGSTADGRDVGTANACFARADGRELSFETEGEDIVDEQTGSTWDVTGTATDGPLAGTKLDPVPTSQHFWFSWTAFEQESGS
jgi:hypothetical protein